MQDEVDVYDMPGGTLSSTISLSVARTALAAASAPGGTPPFVAWCGGVEDNVPTYSSVCDIWDGSAWTVGALSIARSELAAAYDGQSTVYFAGGYEYALLLCVVLSVVRR